MAARDHRVGEIELAVEFERAGLHRQGARGGARLCGLVDDAHPDAELGQPKRQHEPGRPGADDQNVDSASSCFSFCCSFPAAGDRSAEGRTSRDICRQGGLCGLLSSARFRSRRPPFHPSRCRPCPQSRHSAPEIFRLHGVKRCQWLADRRLSCTGRSLCVESDAVCRSPCRDRDRERPGSWHPAPMAGRTRLAFFAICLVVTFALENFGSLTGWLFGRYHFEVGAQLPHVGVIPVIVGPLWFGMGYFAWIVAGDLARRRRPESEPAPQRHRAAAGVRIRDDAVGFRHGRAGVDDFQGVDLARWRRRFSAFRSPIISAGC